MMSQYASMFFAALTSLVLTVLLIPKLAGVSERLGLLDIPNHRKMHSHAVPLVGGVAMMMSIGVAGLLFVPAYQLRGIYAGIILLSVVGFLDDINEIHHRIRIVFQLIAVLGMALISQTTLETFGNLLGYGDINFGIFAIPFTIFTIIGVINAVNMLDGLDGLAGGFSVIAFSAFCTLAFLNGQMPLVILGCTFIGALIGFLYFNAAPARVFMGDAGSTSLGYVLGYYAIKVTHYKFGITPPVAALLIMAVPITDTLIVMTRRKLAGKSPFHPDKTHFHHILVRFGYTKNQAVAILLTLSTLFCMLAVYGSVHRIEERTLFFVYLGYFGLCTLSSISMKRLYRAYVRGKIPLLPKYRRKAKQGEVHAGGKLTGADLS